MTAAAHQADTLDLAPEPRARRLRPVPDLPAVAPLRRPRPVRSDPDTFDPMTAPAGYRPLFDRRPCGRLGPGTCCRDRALWDPELEEE